MGIALISAHTDFRLRIDPEEIEWKYSLNTHVDNTYGGKVIQILSVSIDQMSLPVLSGAGGRDYLRSVANFFREGMLWQRDTGNTAIFTYAPRGYRLKVYFSNLQITDNLQNVSYPFLMVFKVQEDLAGAVKQSIIIQEINNLAAGIGYTSDQFNDPSLSASGNSGVANNSTVNSSGADPSNISPTH